MPIVATHVEWQLFGMVIAAKSIINLIPSISMIIPNHQNLKYGVIYVYFDPRRRSDSLFGESLFENIARPFEIEWVEDPDRNRDNTLLVARRFNVGNLGQYATLTLRLSDTTPRGVQFDALNKFREKLFEVSEMESGDIVIDEDDFRPRYMSRPMNDIILPQAAPQDHTRVESSRRSLRWIRLSKRLKNLITEEDTEGDSNVDEWIANELDLNCEARQDTDYLEEENREVANLERERRMALEHIRHEIINYVAKYHDDPQDLVAELLRGKVIVGQPGRVLVNGDMRIVMPEYDELEIEMPAMCRTLYILFLKHRWQGGNGIVLKNLDEYREEILDIYGLVKPGANERRVMRTVDNLCDPLSDSLNQTISRINRCIRNVITDKELSKDYCITGERGQEYGILLDPQYLELPRAVTGA